MEITCKGHCSSLGKDIELHLDLEIEWANITHMQGYSSPWKVNEVWECWKLKEEQPLLFPSLNFFVYFFSIALVSGVTILDLNHFLKDCGIIKYHFAQLCSDFDNLFQKMNFMEMKIFVRWMNVEVNTWIWKWDDFTDQ